MKLIILPSLLLPAALFLSSCGGKDKLRSNSPNIIIITADDLGYGDVGIYGADDIRTPNLDRIAGEGLYFTDFYSTSPVCSPSRFGLMTGRYPRRRGIDHVFFPESYTGIPEDEVTLAEALRNNGYVTGAIGKWHLGHHHRYLPLQNGFDEYYGIPYSNDMPGVAYLDGNEVDSLKVDQRFTTKTYTEKAVDFIRRYKDEPFFLYLPHNMPHVPLYASPEFEGKSARGLYGDVVEELDWSVGKIIAALEEEGISGQTLVFFTSDNGPWLVYDIEGGSAGPLRDGKGTTFEGGQRVPGIAYWPGTIAAGSVYRNLATQLDLYPTIVALTQSQHSATTKSLDGEDISTVLLGTGSRKGDEFAYYSFGQIEAFRKGEWKIKLPSEELKYGNRIARPASDTLLFNLGSDLGEQNNLLKSHPDKARELLNALEAYKARIDENPPAMVQRMPADNSHNQKREERRAAAKAVK